MSRRAAPTTTRSRLAVDTLEAREVPAGIFGPANPITGANLGPNPALVAVGRFNADANLDLAVTNYGTNTVSILLGRGNGTFAPARAVTVAGANRQPEGIVVLDYNRDGDKDLAVALNNGSRNNVVILENGGRNSGRFFVAQTLSAGNFPTHIAAADLNGDGYQDLAVSNFGGGVKILRNTRGAFTDRAARVSTGGTGCNQILAADLDGDGDRDLAVANQDDGTVAILSNGGRLRFTLTDTLTAGQLGTTFLALGDVSGDGLPDLVASNTFHQPTNTAGSTIDIFVNQGGGAFGPAAPIEVGSTPTGVAVRDITGDGLADIAVGIASTGNVRVLRNDGVGGFLGSVDYPAVGGITGLSVADFNGDGRPDLIATPYVSGNALAILLNDQVGTSVTVRGPTSGQLGQPATFTATARASAGPAPTTGYVSFLDGDNYLDTVAVVDGIAEYTTDTLGAGTHAIRAVYSDAVDLNWYGSSSDSVAFTV